MTTSDFQVRVMDNKAAQCGAEENIKWQLLG